MSLPEKPQPPSPPRSCLPVAVVLMLLTMFAGAPCILVAGWRGPLIVLAIVAFYLLQYLVWGRWLGPLLRAQAERESNGDSSL